MSTRDEIIARVDAFLAKAATVHLEGAVELRLTGYVVDYDEKADEPIIQVDFEEITRGVL